MKTIPYRIVVADHHPLCRAGLSKLLADSLGCSSVVQASDFAHALAAIGRSNDISMIVVDLDLPELNGATGLKRLRADHPELRLVVVTSNRERECVLDSLCAGVHGYILKDTPTEEMVRAFELIHAGHVYVPALVSDISDTRIIATPTPAGGRATLTDRQMEVLRLVAAGRSNKQIARALVIAEGTVKVHITAAFRALGVHNRVSAAAALQVRPQHDVPVTQSLLEVPCEQAAEHHLHALMNPKAGDPELVEFIGEEKKHHRASLARSTKPLAALHHR